MSYPGCEANETCTTLRLHGAMGGEAKESHLPVVFFCLHMNVKACPHLAFEYGLMWIDHVRTIHTIRVNVD